MIKICIIRCWRGGAVRLFWQDQLWPTKHMRLQRVGKYGRCGLRASATEPGSFDSHFFIVISSLALCHERICSTFLFWDFVRPVCFISPRSSSPYCPFRPGLRRQQRGVSSANRLALLHHSQQLFSCGRLPAPPPAAPTTTLRRQDAPMSPRPSLVSSSLLSR